MRLFNFICMTVLLTTGVAVIAGSAEPGQETNGEGSGGGGEHSGGGGEHSGGGGEHSGGGGEHSGEGGESGGGSDEESARQYRKDETYDQIRAGARLVLAYDAGTNAFMGTVENTTSRTLTRVRVEVHLSNGTELGPTTPMDLAPGQMIAISLRATSAPFVTWSAHPEVGGSNGEGGESGEEHSGGESGEQFGHNEDIPEMPTGVWSPDLLSRASFSQVGGQTAVTFSHGGRRGRTGR